MVNDIVKDLEGAIAKAHDSLKRELAKVRTGRANLALIDGVRVDYYGTPTPLNQVASLLDARRAPHHDQAVGEEAVPGHRRGDPQGRARREPDLATAKLVRIPIPSLTEERRRELTKVVKRMAEDARVADSQSRREANEMLKEYRGLGEITEDDGSRAPRRCRTVIDKGIDKVDEIAAKKEAEIMEV